MCHKCNDDALEGYGHIDRCEGNAGDPDRKADERASVALEKCRYKHEKAPVTVLICRAPPSSGVEQCESLGTSYQVRESHDTSYPDQEVLQRRGECFVMSIGVVDAFSAVSFGYVRLYASRFGVAIEATFRRLATLPVRLGLVAVESQSAIQCGNGQDFSFVSTKKG